MATPTWPGWETVCELGRGSFGSVYEIRKQIFDYADRAALKVISLPQSSSEINELYNDGYDAKSISERFQSYLEEIIREYKLMSELKGNPNIVYSDDVYYVQHGDGIGWDIYIKMELLTPLFSVLKIPADEQQVIHLATDMCNALAACRKKNIVHRDIKPQNIFVSQSGDFKLGDFGIAKTAERTTSGTKTGTYRYMAPEVYNNQPYGPAVDIYSLGMVLYWMLNDRRTPFLPLPPAVPTATQDEWGFDSGANSWKRRTETDRTQSLCL
ncbi:serine/threonine-protein kinase [Frisingicoccus sp.]|uniref:serine/threonine-protein kinase n=1 Tax=Frisingicoccus sp. TaxID=1918627 RepID=UPI003AB31743